MNDSNSHSSTSVKPRRRRKFSFGDVAQLKNEPLILITIIAIVVFTLVFTVYPLIQLVMRPSAEEFARLFTSSRWRTAIQNSLVITFFSTISSTTVAFLFAYVNNRLDVPLKKLFRFISLLPIISPPFIIALSYILLFGRRGLVTHELLGLNVNIHGMVGLWIVQTVTFFPQAYAVINGVMKRVPANLEYAAYNMGASRWQVFKDVVLPLARPGIAGGALVAAINIITDFGNPLLIGGGVLFLPSEAYAQIGQAQMGSAAVLATALFIPVLCFFFINRLWVGKRSYVTVTGKEASLPQYPIAPVVKWLLFTLCVLFSLFVLLVYGILLYGSFANIIGVDWSLSLNNYALVWTQWRQIWNSIRFALLAALFSSLVALILAYIVQRKQIGINKTVDFVAILPGAIPGMFLAMGYVMAFNSGPLRLTGTDFIIVVALAFWNLPVCYSSASAGLAQIGNSVEDAALSMGANSFRSFKDIIIPLLKVPFLSSFVIAFLRSITNLSVVIFLYTPRSVVGTISIMNFVLRNQWGSAAAFTVVLIVIAFLVLGVTRWILKKQGITLEL